MPIVREYFPTGTGENIWAELLPVATTPLTNSRVFQRLGEVCLFAPPNEDYSPYLPEWLTLWQTFQFNADWDSCWLYWFSKAVKSSRQSSSSAKPTCHTLTDWTAEQLPFFYGQILASLNLPAGVGKPRRKKKWSHAARIPISSTVLAKRVDYAAKLAIWLLTNDTSKAETEVATSKPAKQLLMELLGTVKTFYHPSNSSSYAGNLSIFLSSLSKHLAKRLGKEKAHCGSSHNLYFLQESSVDVLLSELIDLACLAIYSKSPTLMNSGVDVLVNCLCIKGSLFLKKTNGLELLFAALNADAANQTHQAPSALISLSKLVPILSRKNLHSFFLSPSFLPQLLHSSLLGLDANDFTKTMCTFQMYSSLFDWLPFASEQSDQLFSNEKECQYFDNCILALPEYEVDAYLLDGLIDWGHLFLDRIFILIKASQATGMHSNSSPMKSHQEKALTSVMGGTLQKFFGQMSSSVYTRFAKKTMEFVSSNFLPNGSGKNVSVLIEKCVSTHPNIGLKIFFSFLDVSFGGFQTNSKSQSINEFSDLECIWYGRIMDGLVRHMGVDLMNYQLEINFFLQFLFSSASQKETTQGKQRFKIGCKILRHVLESIGTTYILASSITTSPKAIGHRFTHENFDIKWHLPSTEELTWALELMNLYIVSPMQALQSSLQNSDPQIYLWRKKLKVIYYALRGCIFLLPSSSTSSHLIEALGDMTSQIWKFPPPIWLLELRSTLARFCHDACTFLLQQNDSMNERREVKSVKILLNLMVELMSSRTVKSAKLQLSKHIVKRFKYQVADEASFALKKERRKLAYYNETPFANCCNGVGLTLSRFYFFYRYSVHRQERLLESSFYIANNEVDLIPFSDFYALSTCNYSVIRSRAQTAIFHLRKYCKNWRRLVVQESLSQIIDKGITKDQRTGILYLLSYQSFMEYIGRDSEFCCRLMKNILQFYSNCTTTSADEEDKEMNRMQRLFLVFLQYWQPNQLEQINSIVEFVDYLTMNLHFGGCHWRVQLLILVCLNVAVSLTSSRYNLINKKNLVEFLVKVLVENDADPVRKLAAAVLQRFIQRDNLVLSEKECKVLLMNVAATFVTEHKISMRTADGEREDFGPLQWSVGVTEFTDKLIRMKEPFPRYFSFISQNPSNFLRWHSIFFHFFFTNAACQVDTLWSSQILPLLKHLLSNFQTEEKRAAFCTIGEIVVGVLLSLFHSKQKQDLKSQQQKIMEDLLLFFEDVFVSLPFEWCEEWCSMFGYLLNNHTNLKLKFLEQFYLFFVEKIYGCQLDVQNHDAFAHQAKWLVLIQPFLYALSDTTIHDEMQQQKAELMVFLIDKVLDHPYRLIRENVAMLLTSSTNKRQVCEHLQREVAVILKEKGMKQARETLFFWLRKSFEAEGNGHEIWKNLVIESQVGLLVFETQNHPDKEVSTIAKKIVDVLSQEVRLLSQNDKILDQVMTLCDILKDSEIWHTRAACLRFLTAFLAHHGCFFNQRQRFFFHNMVLHFLQDPVQEVQDMARYTLIGIFAGEQDCTMYIDRAKSGSKKVLAYYKLQKKKNHIQTKNEHGKNEIIELENLCVFSMSALVLAHPYDVPDYLPDLLEKLAQHHHSSLTSTRLHEVVKHTFSEFKRTHHDNWHQHKLQFTRDQLDIVNDLLVSPHYYA